MRQLPMVNNISKTEQVTNTFYGLNHTLKIADGEAWDMSNITNDYYPLLSPRKPRAKLTSAASSACQGILAKDKLAYVSGNRLYYDGEQTPVEVTAGQKTLVSFGAYILIFPDTAYYNTADATDYGMIDFTVSVAEPTLYNCTADGEKITVDRSDSKPTSPEDGKVWLERVLSEDTGELDIVMWRYDGALEEWRKVEDTYVAMVAEGIGQGYNFTIEGLGNAISQSSPEEIAIETAAKLNGRHTAVLVEPDKVVIKGIIYADEWSQATTASQVSYGGVAIKANVPKMDFVIEGNNRLWGCKYGMVDGELINEIYASKLGDFKDWQSYQGIASDSYTASIGTDGTWTGAINYNGYPLFFKDNMLHKVYISSVGAHEIKQIPCAGVEQGSSQSLAIVDGVLHYKSQSGIMEYDGSSFTRISDKLGMNKYKNAVAGAFDNKYYISMQGEDSNYSLFVYDSAKGLWAKEDSLHATGFAQLDGSLYCIASNGDIYDLQAADGTVETEAVEWMWQTGLMGYEYTGKKYISRFNIRMQLPQGAEIKIYIEYDTSGKWELKGKLKGKGTKTFLLPIIPRRCDNFKIRLCGKGDAKIYSFSKMFEGGSDA